MGKELGNVTTGGGLTGVEANEFSSYLKKTRLGLNFQD